MLANVPLAATPWVLFVCVLTLLAMLVGWFIEPLLLWLRRYRRGE